MSEPTTRHQHKRVGDTISCHDDLVAEARQPDVHDLLMKGAEIGYTYGALGRDFAGVLPEIARLTRQSSEPSTAEREGAE